MARCRASPSRPAMWKISEGPGREDHGWNLASDTFSAQSTPETQTDGQEKDNFTDMEVFVRPQTTLCLQCHLMKSPRTEQLARNW